jgi:hypothetical protein
VADNDPIEKPTLTGLASSLSKLPTDTRRAALEVSAALAGVSLRVSREFVEAVPKAAKILSAEDLRQWGEFGRRLAMGNADLGVSFFAAGVAGLRVVPEDARGYVFQICTRQLVLSSSIAIETFKRVPRIAREVEDKLLLSNILKLAVDIAQRSAKHSAEFLEKTPALAAALARFDEGRADVVEAILTLATQFAHRTGGMTADLWAGLPEALEKVDAAKAAALLQRSAEFLEFGGSVTLHFVASGSDVLASFPEVFEAWCRLARTIARSGNAVLISFLRATPRFFRSYANRSKFSAPDIERIIELTREIAEVDAESALAAYKSSSTALERVTLKQFEAWVERGLAAGASETPKSRRSYFALETRASNAQLHNTRRGLALEKVQSILRMYIEALTGREVEIAPIGNLPSESRIGDGRTIYLPASVDEFETDDEDFRLYKVLAAHGAGQIEFGTFAKDTIELKAVYSELARLYEATAEQLDAFSLAGYIEDVQTGERATGEEPKPKAKKLPKDSDYRTVLDVFPEPRLARKIFGTMENARIDASLRRTYRGLVKDLDLMQSLLRANRPYIFDLPAYQVPFELLFQITLCGGATDDARRFYGPAVSEIETVVERFVAKGEPPASAGGPHRRKNSTSGSTRPPADAGGSPSTVADSLMATSRVYNLFQNINPEQTAETESETDSNDSDFVYDDKESAESVTEDKIKTEQMKEAQDVRDLFSAWNEAEEDDDSDDLSGSETWSQQEMPEQPLEQDDVAFAYDEWDRELNDYRVGWSRVIEKRVKQGDRTFVELTRSRYRGVISSIRHQFQLMKPENLTRINKELDGEDYDLNALVDFVIDRRADGKQTENIYTKRLRRQRDVAVSLLLDQSSSTARTITRNPLQPYTHPGRRIIEIEKEGLVLMSEALEAVGDVYSIYGFTSEGRRNVKFYVVKDFHEKYSDETERRIGGISFQNNTRLGAAIRHAAHKLVRQESRTKLLILLTDGRPYDHDYGDARYAREDVREALLEAKTHGIIPFCITIDRESEAELRDLYGDVGYTIIDDVLSLPERMPNIYRRLTS